VTAVLKDKDIYIQEVCMEYLNAFVYRIRLCLGFPLNKTHTVLGLSHGSHPDLDFTAGM